MFDFEDDDLPFMSQEDRARALGLELPGAPRPGKGEIPAKARNQQPPPPGHIVILLPDVARARGVVNTKGPYAGHVSLSGIQRATDLAATTVNRLLHRPEKLDMIHLETLARLCAGLRCQPGELLRYVPGRR